MRAGLFKDDEIVAELDIDATDVDDLVPVMLYGNEVYLLAVADDDELVVVQLNPHNEEFCVAYVHVEHDRPSLDAVSPETRIVISYPEKDDDDGAEEEGS